MAARKFGSGSRHLSIEERVNIAEGEDELSESDDGLDMVKTNGKGQVSFDEYINSIDAGDNMVEISSDEGSPAAKKQRRGIYHEEKGERVAFDDDEDSDAVYKSFIKRHTEKKKKAAASNKRVKARAAGSSLVGKRAKPARKAKDENQVYGDPSDDDKELMEDSLPEYLQTRMKEWERCKQRLGEKGLRLPPTYDDMYFSDDERLETLKERPKLPTNAHPGNYEDHFMPKSGGLIPAPIAQYLRNYQVEGAEFLHEKFVFQQGGILGDDMGLGKTIQVIAFLTAAFGKTGDERDKKRMRKSRRKDEHRFYPKVLIICPGSLMSNWRSELERWGWWHIATYHNSGKADAIAAAEQGRLEIMITTYQTYRLDQSAINSVMWDCVIADECHIIKERKSEITKSMNRVNALCRIGLTGTAIQNKYEELWTLLNWTNPGTFGPMNAWKQAICIPLKLGQSYDATNAQLAKARRTATKLRDNLLPQFFRRRTKKMIAAELPKKSDRVVFCPMTDTQADAYNNFCDSEIVQAIRHAVDPCTCGSGKKQGWCCYQLVDGQKWQNFVFPVMITLQKLSSHVALLIPSNESDRERHDKDLELLRTALPDMWESLYRERQTIMNYGNTAFCGKWKILRKLLSYWHENGDKVLVFSYSVRLLKMLTILFKSTTSYNVSYLDGSMSYEERQNTVDEFNSDPRQFVFLISTKAGGVGLNITSANKVVVVDPNWNPSYDLQAQDRAYRIGQTRDVQVFRLISVGTIEECIYARQIYKQQQANIGYNASVERRYFKGVQGQKEQKGEIFGLGNMFAPLSTNIKLRDIVNNTNIAETRAGVEIAGLDMEASQDDDDDTSDPLLEEGKADAAMSQLAADIIDEPGLRRKAAAKTAKKKDAVQAILASAGVEYTHENAEVVGTSKIEMKISSRAQKAGNDIGLDTDYAFARNASQLDPVAEASKSHAAAAPGSDDGDTDDDLDSKAVKYKYRPPKDVLQRQFCSMAKVFGYEDPTEFALVVEGWTQEQRRRCLERFYEGRREKCRELSFPYDQEGGNDNASASASPEGNDKTTPGKKATLTITT
ncbi:uncharacterized protein LTR77_008618 [Saxophila tyrrhenica]|uniref:Uncharacterized protein n=1 Tax=Saxophila tyrrhenica TaxID=1690608 RepID=A0AAV9NZT6_9PEZI|nr:hypothetical protein LTR77_008618 [Saxophila tyrrhenica]